MTSYTGAWKRQTLPDNRLPLKPGIDPQHTTPTDGPDPQAVDMTGAPLLPDEWSSTLYVQAPVPTVVFDATPELHTAGVGTLPGVDQQSAQLVSDYAHNVDQGAADALRYHRPQYQEDGSTHAVIVSHDLDGDSPATVAYEDKGVGVANDPYARSNTRITRRPTGPETYDARWYDVEYRPRYTKNGQGSAVRGPVPNRQVNTPPEGAGTILRPDNWASPIIRRSAPDWDQPFATDQQTGPVALDFGLGSWGL